MYCGSSDSRFSRKSDRIERPEEEGAGGEEEYTLRACLHHCLEHG
jgi:hypothetical protein